MAGTYAVIEIDQIDDLEFERRTLAAIRNELGLGGLARFLMTYRSARATTPPNATSGSTASPWKTLPARCR
jgi:hypothetical protein